MNLLACGALAALCAAALRPAPARACSVTETFMPPTNVELVAKTPRIVVATVTAAAGGEDLTSLIQGYGEAHHARADARLKEIGSRTLTAEPRKWLDRAVDDRARK